MDPMTAIGIVIILASTFLGSQMGGINFISILFSDIGSIVLVLGGALGATAASGTIPDAVGGIKVMLKAFLSGKTGDAAETIAQLVSFAEAARRDGLLALEEQVKTVEDPFMRRGIQMAIDGTDPEVVREVMETEIAAMEERHKQGQNFTNSMVAYGPAFGMAGTVIGLIALLGQLSDPAALGPSMAVAFVTTLWGTFLANYLFSPMTAKLKRASALELAQMTLVLEGVMSIQAGSNPRAVGEKLKAFLSPNEREALDVDKKTA